MPAAFDRLVVLDYEATCDNSDPPVPQEVIEFPSVLVSLTDRAVVDSFSTFVRPVHHPTLSAFCTELTTIRQADVDPAPVFPEVLAAHRAWLEGHGLFDSQGRERFAFVTCGDWDLQTMLPVQCGASGIPISALPPVYRRWINIKKVFLAVMKKAKTTGMPAMLQALGLELQGTHHRGIDDCHNIARLVFALADRGARFDLTGKLAASHYPELALDLQWGDRVERIFLKKRHLASLLGLASGVFHARMVRVLGPDGAAIEDDDPLAELPPESRLRVLSARDLAT